MYPAEVLRHCCGCGGFSGEAAELAIGCKAGESFRIGGLPGKWGVVVTAGWCPTTHALLLPPSYRRAPIT